MTKEMVKKKEKNVDAMICFCDVHMYTSLKGSHGQDSHG